MAWQHTQGKPGWILVEVVFLTRSRGHMGTAGHMGQALRKLFWMFEAQCMASLHDLLILA